MELSRTRENRKLFIFNYFGSFLLPPSMKGIRFSNSEINPTLLNIMTKVGLGTSTGWQTSEILVDIYNKIETLKFLWAGIRVKFKWLSLHQNESNYSSQSKQTQKRQWTKQIRRKYKREPARNAVKRVRPNYDWFLILLLTGRESGGNFLSANQRVVIGLIYCDFSSFVWGKYTQLKCEYKMRLTQVNHTGRSGIANLFKSYCLRKPGRWSKMGVGQIIPY